MSCSGFEEEEWQLVWCRPQLPRSSGTGKSSRLALGLVLTWYWDSLVIVPRWSTGGKSGHSWFCGEWFDSAVSLWVAGLLPLPPPSAPPPLLLSSLIWSLLNITFNSFSHFCSERFPIHPQPLLLLWVPLSLSQNLPFSVSPGSGLWHHDLFSYHLPELLQIRQVWQGLERRPWVVRVNSFWTVSFNSDP